MVWFRRIGFDSIHLLSIAALFTCFMNGSQSAFQKCSTQQFVCPTTQWRKNIITYPDKWYADPDFQAAFNIPSTVSTISASEYISKYMPCCQHCAWSLYYPKALPIVFAISPSQDTCAASNVATATLGTCYLDCTMWPLDFNILDSNKDSKLSSSEFSQYIVNPAFAPPMLYYLYTGLQQTYSASFSALDSSVVMLTVDLNKDGVISLEEWMAFRHYIGPILTTRSGPYMTSSDGRPLAQGPLAGLFIDSALNKIWQSKVIMMLMNYYINHNGQGFQSLNLREPTSNEAVSVFQQGDLDGSGRISFEEHYFKRFADKDGNGMLDKTEYYASLYRTTCSTLCPQRACTCPACAPSASVAAGCNAAPDAAAAGANLKQHDVDEDGNVTFIERKFIAADTNLDMALSWDEWRLADLPAAYGAFQGSISCAAAAGANASAGGGGGACASVDRAGYRNYMAYHYCSMQSLLLYTSFPSPFPLSSSCTVVLKVRADDPFVTAVKTTDPEGGNYSSMGWACYGPDLIDGRPGAQCFDGFGIRMLTAAAGRLGWTLRPVIEESKSPLLPTLGVPRLAPGGGGGRLLELALVTSLKEVRDSEAAGLQSSSLSCSQSLLSQDGLVVVKRAAQTGVIIEMSIFAMIISAPFVNFVTFCFFAVIVGGHIFWFLERKQNPQFDPGYLMGVIDGSWFAMVTVSTVGYGDKVPVTLTAKSATVIWMFFGILAFGVFCSNISAQLNLASAENSIQSVTDLKSLPVGVPKYLTASSSLPNHFSLGKEYGFEQTDCATLPDCVNMLLNKGVAAIIVPLPDILAHFVSTGLSKAACGNPLIIAGNSFSIKSLAPPMVQVCGYSSSVYVTSYLTNALSTTIADMQSDGTAGDLEKAYLQAAAGQPSMDQLANPQCAPATLFRITQLIAFGVVFGFYVTVNITARVVRKRLADQRVKEHLETAVVDGDSDAGGVFDSSNTHSSGDKPGREGATAELVFGEPRRSVRFDSESSAAAKAGDAAGDLRGEADLAAADGGADDAASKEAAAAAMAAGLAKDPVAGLVRRISRIQRLQVESLGELTEQVRVGQEAISRVAVVCGWILVPIMALVAALAVALLFLWVYNSRFVYL